MKNASDDLGNALRELAKDGSAKSETARLRDIFDDVEDALRSGVRRQAVLSKLNENGFTMTAASFKSALQRIRRERAESAEA